MASLIVIEVKLFTVRLPVVISRSFFLTVIGIWEKFITYLDLLFGLNIKETRFLNGYGVAGLFVFKIMIFRLKLVGRRRLDIMNNPLFEQVLQYLSEFFSSRATTKRGRNNSNQQNHHLSIDIPQR